VADVLSLTPTSSKKKKTGNVLEQTRVARRGQKIIAVFFCYSSLIAVATLSTVLTVLSPHSSDLCSRFLVLFVVVSLLFFSSMKQLKLNSVALVSKRTIPTERPPLVGVVSANFCG
jgi:hypothetical protein